MHTPTETKDKIKAKRNAFSTVSDVVVEESCLFFFSYLVSVS